MSSFVSQCPNDLHRFMLHHSNNFYSMNKFTWICDYFYNGYLPDLEESVALKVDNKRIVSYQSIIQNEHKGPKVRHFVTLYK